MIPNTRSKLALLSVLFISSGSMASAALFADFTAAGGSGGANSDGFVFSVSDGGVSFDVTASAVIPVGGGANGGDIARINAGLGSTVENTGAFLNVINGTAEVLQFTVSNVSGLSAGESLVVRALLSQNPSSTNADQSGGFGGTFGNVAGDNALITSDDGPSIVVRDADGVDTGSVLLATDENNSNNTGNTFSFSDGDLAFTDSFTIQINDAANNAFVVQGFEFAVVPEPSTSALVGLGGLALLLRRRR
ncbi:hypothetical protein NT6N_39920 [Oceaniferula spumae]|uniref:Ice-binding protein C-terminal domain-containing protein n=1 Tax=Oceaniferula spumae TaxID=2979115 RepID=A0AAT9FSG9_9BACT